MGNLLVLNPSTASYTKPSDMLLIKDISGDQATFQEGQNGGGGGKEVT